MAELQAKIEGLVRKRSSVERRLAVFKRFIDTLLDKDLIEQTDIINLESRVPACEPLISQFQDIQDELESLADDDDYYNSREQFETEFYSSIAKAKQILIENSRVECADSVLPENVSETGSETARANIKLPRIELPTFDGSYDKWSFFYDTFKSLIHDSVNLGDIQKFHYLRSALKGEAAQVIQSLEVSTANYQSAWQLLERRYKNKKLMIHNHIKNIVEFPKVQKDSFRGLRQLLDATQNHLRSLEALEEPVNSWDSILIYLIVDKLDFFSQREWEAETANTESMPTVVDLFDFLQRRCQLLEKLNKSAKTIVNKPQTQTKVAHASSKGVLVCHLCKGPHQIYSCKQFLDMNIESRIEQVKKLRLCLNCLRPGHISSNCTSSNCQKCSKKHNTLLHITNPNASNANVVKSNQQSDTSVLQNIEQNLESQTMSNHARISKNFEQLLPTAVINVFDVSGNPHSCRVLLDVGSQANFITDKLCSQLKLHTCKVNIPTFGVGNVKTKISKSVNVTIGSKLNNYKVNLSFSVLPHITQNIPSVKIDASQIKIPDNVILADYAFAQPGSIDLLVGVDIFWDLLRPSPLNNSYLHNTVFGFVISGRIPQNQSQSFSSCNFTVQDVSEHLTQFWEIENCPSSKVWSAEELFCEEVFSRTTRRHEDGRFIVSLPIKGSLDVLGHSKDLAIRRFLSLEKRFESNPTYRDLYVAFMREYQEIGYMSEVPQTEIDVVPSYFMPHHGVLKDDSLTTRLRVVFNGSCPSSTGVSINDMQCVGPTIQPSLFSILIKFRLPKYAVSADITRMYNQVLIEPSQKQLQRIVWRENPSEPLRFYNLNTVTYGTASASFLAIRCLFQLAKEHEVEYPEVADIIRNSMYVDDLLFGTNDYNNTFDLCQQITHVLKGGGFELRKWASNEPSLLEGVKNSEVACNIVDFGTCEYMKTLGVAWSCKFDTLIYRTNLNHDNQNITKREILSTISKIFDPLGLLSPCTITTKILIQKIWLEKLAWDDPIPQRLKSVWHKLYAELQLLNQLQIKRRVVCDRFERLEICGFCDASEQAYGACIYVRSITSNGEVSTHLLCSKTKVAPLKTVSLPRLELLGAQVLAKLMHSVKQVFQSENISLYYWTDSQIVLGWLKTEPHLLKTFVSNRVSDIQALSSSESWSHVPGKSNPADLLTRGVSPGILKDSELWWYGPDFLRATHAQWPSTSFSEYDIALPELKPCIQSLAVIQPKNLINFEKFSVLSKLEFTIAWCLRYIHNSRPCNERISGPLTASEIQRARKILLKFSQHETFSVEIKNLKDNKQVPKGSKLQNLNPFLDADGILRVGGRLTNSNCSFDKRHPVVLSSSHHLAKLIFRREHIRLMHAGPQHLLASIRERYWPISGRNLARKTIHECITCFRSNPKTVFPQMGSLPKFRVTPSFPFSSVGVDYAGPFLVKDRKGRGSKVSKCYLSVFICLVTKSVHLEIVSDLSKEGFIMTLRRFSSRRGMPNFIYSDNGTNFVSANNELKELGKFLMSNQNELTECLVKQDFNWQFIPAYSPHFGGIYEAAVKSSKYHLKRTIGNLQLTFEELYSVIVQIEGILNSRPLTPLSTDPHDLQPLTPAHFLIGRPITSVPDPDLSHIPSNRLSQFQAIQQVQQQFWRRWSVEYLSTLQERVKWKQTQQNLKIGSLVLIRDDHLPPLKWLLGRVEQLHTGSDATPRVVSIRTSSGIIRRAVARICPLPVEDLQVEE